jgi:flagellar basal body-associated protein FliL
MSRPETQLREYFDAGVERVSVEDVIARARVSEGGLRPPHAKRNLRPAWAAVGAFAATLVGLGGLASVLKLSPRIHGEAGAGAAEGVEVGGGTIGVWLITAAVAAVAAGLAVWLVHRSTKRTENKEEIVSDQGKVMVMETIERTDTEDRTTEKTEHRSRWPIVVIVVMAIALVGFIAWMTLAMRPNSPTAAPPEVVELMDEYTAAFNAYDADALEVLVTPQYRVHSEGEVVDSDMEGVRSDLFGWMESVNWHSTNEGPYYAVETGTGTWLVSSEGGTNNRSGTDYPEMGVLRIRTGPDGTLLVADHYFTGG